MIYYTSLQTISTTSLIPTLIGNRMTKLIPKTKLTNNCHIFNDKQKAKALLNTLSAFLDSPTTPCSLDITTTVLKAGVTDARARTKARKVEI